MDTITLPTRSPPVVVRARLWTAACWIPVGFAVTRFVADGSPMVAMVCLAAGAAGLHRISAGLVEVVAGSGGFLLTLFAAADGWSYGAVVVLAYGSVMTVSAFVRLLGSGNGREMAKHLLVATAALELAVFAARSGGPSVEVAVLVVATVVGLRARFGFAILGAALLVALCWQVPADVAVAVDPVVAIVGSVTFALAAHLVADRKTAPLMVERS